MQLARRKKNNVLISLASVGLAVPIFLFSAATAHANPGNSGNSGNSGNQGSGQITGELEVDLGNLTAPPGPGEQFANATDLAAAYNLDGSTVVINNSPPSQWTGQNFAEQCQLGTWPQTCIKRWGIETRWVPDNPRTIRDVQRVFQIRVRDGQWERRETETITEERTYTEVDTVTEVKTVDGTQVVRVEEELDHETRNNREEVKRSETRDGVSFDNIVLHTVTIAPQFYANRACVYQIPDPSGLNPDADGGHRWTNFGAFVREIDNALRFNPDLRFDSQYLIDRATAALALDEGAPRATLNLNQANQDCMADGAVLNVIEHTSRAIVNTGEISEWYEERFRDEERFLVRYRDETQVRTQVLRREGTREREVQQYRTAERELISTAPRYRVSSRGVPMRRDETWVLFREQQRDVWTYCRRTSNTATWDCDLPGATLEWGTINAWTNTGRTQDIVMNATNWVPVPNENSLEEFVPIPVTEAEWSDFHPIRQVEESDWNGWVRISGVPATPWRPTVWNTSHNTVIPPTFHTNGTDFIGAARENTTNYNDNQNENRTDRIVLLFHDDANHQNLGGDASTEVLLNRLRTGNFYYATGARNNPTLNTGTRIALTGADANRILAVCRAAQSEAIARAAGANVTVRSARTTGIYLTFHGINDVLHTSNSNWAMETARSSNTNLGQSLVNLSLTNNGDNSLPQGLEQWPIFAFNNQGAVQTTRQRSDVESQMFGVGNAFGYTVVCGAVANNLRSINDSDSWANNDEGWFVDEDWSEWETDNVTDWSTPGWTEWDGIDGPTGEWTEWREIPGTRTPYLVNTIDWPNIPPTVTGFWQMMSVSCNQSDFLDVVYNLPEPAQTDDEAPIIGIDTDFDIWAETNTHRNANDRWHQTFTLRSNAEPDQRIRLTFDFQTWIFDGVRSTTEGQHGGWNHIGAEYPRLTVGGVSNDPTVNVRNNDRPVFYVNNNDNNEIVIRLDFLRRDGQEGIFNVAPHNFNVLVEVLDVGDNTVRHQVVSSTAIGFTDTSATPGFISRGPGFAPSELPVAPISQDNSLDAVVIPVQNQNVVFQANTVSGSLRTHYRDYMPTILDLGDVNNPNPALAQTGTIAFYDKECPFVCIADPNNHGASVANGAVFNQRDNNATGIAWGAWLSNEAGFTNDNHFELFRHNEPLRDIVNVDVWFPLAIPGEVEYNGEAPLTTTIIRNDIPESMRRFFTMEALGDTNNPNNTNRVPLFSGSGQIGNQTNWNTSSAQGRNASIVSGLQRSFDVRSSWASTEVRGENYHDHEFNFVWEYSPNVVSLIPVFDIGFGHNDGQMSYRESEVRAAVQGRCYAHFGTDYHTPTTVRFHENTGTGTSGWINNVLWDADGDNNTRLTVDFWRAIAE